MKQLKNIILLIIVSMLCACQTQQENKQINPQNKWKGKWERYIWQDEASLEITEIKNDTLVFTLFANSGSHTGGLEGYAEIEGNKATYIEVNDIDTCIITFNLFGDTLITINQKTNNCFAGLGVNYSGNYKNELLIGKNKPIETLFSLGIFKNKQQDSVFRILVKDKYDLFLNSTDLITEREDLDNLNTIVKSSGVKGLFTVMENIIMIDDKNTIWAAVISDSKVLYFTNKQSDINKLPKTINTWRENFNDYPILWNAN